MDKKIWVVGIVFIILVAGLFYIVNRLPASAEPIYDNKVIEISLSDITDEASWYAYDANGMTIRYFAVKTNDGSLKTGFDACDVCHESGKGYSQDGDFMVCNNCGNRYHISGLGTENQNPGGCWPGYLPSYVEGDKIIIKESNLIEGKWRFA